MEETFQQLDAEEKQNKKLLDEIETKHLNLGKMQFLTRNFKLILVNQGSRLNQHFKMFQNPSIFSYSHIIAGTMTITLKEYLCMKSLLAIMISPPKLIAIMSESYSTIAENFRGNICIPNAQTYIQQKKTTKYDLYFLS